MRFFSKSLLLLCLLFAACGSSFGQAATGVPPFTSFSGSPDQVNLANLNVRQTFPIFHKPGRMLPFIFDLNHDTTVWYPAASGNSTVWQLTLTGGFSASPSVGGVLIA